MKTKPTHDEFLAAIEVLKAYAPDKFLNIKPVKHNHGTPEGLYIIQHDSWYQLASCLTGEVLPNQLSLILKDGVDDPLTASGEFLVQSGEVAKESVLPKTNKSLVITRFGLDDAKLNDNFAGKIITGTISIDFCMNNGVPEFIDENGEVDKPKLFKSMDFLREIDLNV